MFSHQQRESDSGLQPFQNLAQDAARWEAGLLFSDDLAGIGRGSTRGPLSLTRHLSRARHPSPPFHTQAMLRTGHRTAWDPFLRTPRTRWARRQFVSTWYATSLAWRAQNEQETGKIHE